MLSKLATFTVFFFATGLWAVSGNSKTNDFIMEELPSSAAPGIAYALVDGAGVSAQGYGETLKGSGEAVTADTLFRIGSVTKSFTALAVMQLVEDGAVKLENPVRMYLAGFTGEHSREITVRQLLDHTSGFSTVQGNASHGNGDLTRLELTDYANQLGYVGPANTPGKAWEYSNANYQILGALVEEVSGSTYPKYIRARIFEPLGMDDSLVAGESLPAGAATGHTPWFGGVRPYVTGEGRAIDAPAGGIISSARDMGQYLAMWMNGQDDVVSASSKRAMWTSSDPASSRYGLGWSIDPEQGSVYHTGLVPGFETLASFVPETGRGVVIMVNANSGLGFSDTWNLIGGVASRSMGLPSASDGARWGPKMAYLSIAFLPPLFVLMAIVSWRRRS